ncbi:kinase-like domain-containing protein [Papiliotrema laurentii]|uniref:Aurora kinase n=1 Tax=Papiliotrema laurentii TaxID=5418 RepID=A0AAD9L826_PAPLA|nr:kinase-like domain-containing protein [Papiliotrema laurentii]
MSADIGAYDGGFERQAAQSTHESSTPARRQARAELDEHIDRAGPSQNWSLVNFDIGRPLGKGHFGKVYLARVKAPLEPFILVLKCLLKDEVIDQNVQNQVRREIEPRHPNVLRLYGWFHDTSRIFLMLEFAGKGEVYKQLAKSGRFSEKRSSRYIRQVADGLAYLHTKNVIHRDIKPENLLIGMNGEIKIGDFGWSVYSPQEDSQRTIAGTLSYVAPEMILGQPYGRAVDIWALGVLTYEFLCGEEPFAADTSAVKQQRICRVDVRYPEHVSLEARDLMNKLFRPIPAERMPLCEVPARRWIKMHHETEGKRHG